MEAVFNEYKVGDVVEFHTSGPDWIKGIVKDVLDYEDYGYKHYVIEVSTSFDPVLEIRTGFVLEMRLAKD